MVSRTSQPLAEKAIAAVEDGRTQIRSRATGPMSISTGCATSSPGAFRASSGGAIRFRSGTTRTATSTVAETRSRSAGRSARKRGTAATLTRDPDVLDTWFSSALWPFSTLGWPDKTPELARFYPTTVLVTGFDIIFFWVARMMMMGLHFMDEVPFHTVFIHTRVLDEKGAEMSKTKGNVVDPLDPDRRIRRRCAALHAGAGGGAEPRHAHRPVARGDQPQLRHQAVECGALLRDEWLRHACRISIPQASARPSTNGSWRETARRRGRCHARAGGAALQRSAQAPPIISSGDVFCDWYLEFIKPCSNGGDEAAKAETRATAAWVRDQILKLLHPFMPFITEELWARTAERDAARDAADRGAVAGFRRLPQNEARASGDATG